MLPPVLVLSRVRVLLLFLSALALFFPASVSAAVVTLDSITIYNTHEWLDFSPDVYFQCKGENKTELPDVKKKNVKYTFKGEESWQRCGFYEHDTLKSDDIFSEWEFCASEFTSSDASISAAVVTLDSITIYNTHEWLNFSPDVYFQCKGENKTVLPDVKKKNVKYTFKGEESWQPLTNITGGKCKRCGFYEHDTLKSDDIFSEWEFCASEFTSSDGKYSRFEEKEFNATFLCPECVSIADSSEHSSTAHRRKGRLHWLLVLLITTLVSLVFVVGAAIAFKYWQKRKKQQEQARFLQLFEDGDDIEDELGIAPLSHEI